MLRPSAVAAAWLMLALAWAGAAPSASASHLEGLELAPNGIRAAGGDAPSAHATEAYCGGFAPMTTSCALENLTVFNDTFAVIGFRGCAESIAGPTPLACGAARILAVYRQRDGDAVVTYNCTLVAVFVFFPGVVLANCTFQGRFVPGAWDVSCTAHPGPFVGLRGGFGDWRCGLVSEP